MESSFAQVELLTVKNTVDWLSNELGLPADQHRQIIPFPTPSRKYGVMGCLANTSFR